MTRILSALGLVFIIQILISCNEQFVLVPSVMTNNVDGIGIDVAIAHSSIIDLGNGISDHGHCIGTTSSPVIENGRDSLGEATQLYAYSNILEDLIPNSTYYVRAYVVSENQVYYGEEITFNTAQGLVEVSTDEIYDVMATSAKCKGTLLFDGHQPITGGVLWGESPEVDFGSYLGLKSNTLNSGEFEVLISPLDTSKLYYVRSFAVSMVDTTYGEIRSFITKNGIVLFGALYYTETTSTSLVCHSSIIDDGGSPISDRGICWSESEYPTIYGDYIPAGEGIGDFSCEVTGLKAGQKYFFRTFATNGIKTCYSKQITVQKGSGK